MAIAVESEIYCLWTGCEEPGPFVDHPTLFEHLCAEHKPPAKRALVCRWRGCVFTSHTSQQYADHLIRHTSYRPHCCTYPGCNKTFNFRPNMLLHSGHHDWSCVAAYPCNWSDCTAAPFADPAELRAHLQETHVPSAAHGARCGWAGCRTTLDRRHIAAHIATHLPPDYKPFRCITCNKAFRTAGGLNRHISRTHSDAESPRGENGADDDRASAIHADEESAVLVTPRVKRGREEECGTQNAKRFKDLEGDSESELDIVITVKLEATEPLL